MGLGSNRQIIVRFLAVISLIVLFERNDSLAEVYSREKPDPLSPLANKCFDTSHLKSWWSYVWCFRDDVRQMHFDENRDVIESYNFIGKYVPHESLPYREVFRHNTSDCQSLSGLFVLRHANVIISCCRNENWSAMHDRFESISELGTFIESVSENAECEYNIRVCSDLLCPTLDIRRAAESDHNRFPSEREDNYEHYDTAPGFEEFLAEQNDHSKRHPGDAYVTEIVQSTKLDRVREMFYHGYDMYMANAQPESELRPLSCDGGRFELSNIPLVTLIDTLDTLVIMGNHTEFRRAVTIISSHYGENFFDLNVNVSVFETTIRVLGGLLAAHLMAVDPLLGIYRNYGAKEFDGDYDNALIILAYDLGLRLLPAFVTPTGIPYGTVNLMHGVPIGETEVASTAGAGSLFLEFDVLSALTSDDRFGDAAFNAVQALYNRRSYFGLLGKHIHTGSGLWHESTSGVGSNADSFYEYLLKGHLLSHRSTLLSMFADTYHAVKRHVQVGDWFTEVDMFNGKTRRNRVENLQAFWPGMESILGLCDSAARLLNTFYAVWEDIGFLPEEFDQAAWLDSKVINDSWYPLRPELIESTYLQYRSTGDRTWLTAGSLFLDNLENTRTECGYASISNIGSMQLTNNMPSYFLSETCKYLYLLFDEHNFVHDRPYIFSTEAHPFDPMQLPMRSPSSSASSVGLSGEGAQLHGFFPKLPLKCQKGVWWASSCAAYDANYVRDQRRDASSAIDTDTDDLKTVKGSIRQSTTFSNSAKVAAMLQSFLSRDLDDSDARKGEVAQHMPREYRRPSTCYDEDVQILQPPETADFQANSAKDPDVSRKITISAEKLGDFEVTVYPDGFMVHSKNEKDTLEITNVGERLVFVGYMDSSPSAKSKTIVGDRFGKTVTCTVSLTDRLGGRLVGDEDRSCSIGTFGPQSLPSSAVIGELHVPSEDNAKLCKPLALFPRTSATRVNRDSPSDVTKSGKAKSWWSEWPSASSISTMLSLAYPKRIKRQSAQDGGRIVFAKRGDCLFEEKAANAEAAGAAAVIVSNSEDFLFVMSGRKQSKSVGNQGPPHAGSIHSNDHIVNSLEDPDLTIPTVMITKSDAEGMINVIEMNSKINAPDVLQPIKARIDLISSPSMLDSTYMGSSLYPKLRVGHLIVHVISSETWGVALNSSNGQEWQLYIMSAADVDASMAAAPWHGISQGHQPVSTYFTGAAGALNLYRNAIARQCPTHLDLDNGQVLVHNI